MNSNDSMASRVEVRLHRRRQMVVVRAGESQAAIEPPAGRRRMPTLIGLDYRERLDTLREEWMSDSPRPRPTVLVDGVDDDLAQTYRAEAERILREGLLPQIQAQADHGEALEEPPPSGVSLRESATEHRSVRRSWWQGLWRGTLVRAG